MTLYHPDPLAREFQIKTHSKLRISLKIREGIFHAVLFPRSCYSSLWSDQFTQGSL